MCVYFGAVAHLGERIHGMDEVAGSSPVSSTKFIDLSLCLGFFYWLIIKFDTVFE